MRHDLSPKAYRKPPNAVILSPVSHWALSEARNTATLAMSSGCPKRASALPCDRTTGLILTAGAYFTRSAPALQAAAS